MSNKIKTFFDSILEIITQAKSDLLGVRDGLIAQGYDVENVPSSEYGEMVENISGGGGVSLSAEFDTSGPPFRPVLTGATVTLSDDLTLTIPDEVAEINAGACESLYYITKVVLPDSVTAINGGTTPPRGAFRYCYSLKEMVMSKQLTKIGYYAFYQNFSLKTILIPKTVTEIQDYAFGDCTLTDVFYEGTQEEWQLITIGTGNSALTNATIHYNYSPEDN